MLKTKHHGSTDKLIIERVLQFHEIEADEETIENVAKAMSEYAEKNGDAENGIELLAGVEQLLRLLSRRDDCIVVLVTVNLEPIGWAKMKSLGILDYFDRNVRGGFGSDHVERSELVSIAHSRAVSEGYEIKKRYHFGDTPNDVIAAEKSSAIPIGVATGIFSLDDLRAVSQNKSSSIFIESLGDTSAVLDLLDIF